MVHYGYHLFSIRRGRNRIARLSMLIYVLDVLVIESRAPDQFHSPSKAEIALCIDHKYTA